MGSHRFVYKWDHTGLSITKGKIINEKIKAVIAK